MGQSSSNSWLCCRSSHVGPRVKDMSTIRTHSIDEQGKVLIFEAFHPSLLSGLFGRTIPNEGQTQGVLNAPSRPG